MRAKISAAAHVGRIGALALTLGVGAAIATGQGVALADTADSGSPAASSSSPPSTPGTSSKTSGVQSKSSNTSAGEHKTATPATSSGSTASTAAKLTNSKAASPPALVKPAPAADTTPVTDTASVPTGATAKQPAQTLVSGSSTATGFASSAIDPPVDPAEPPAVWTLLAAARKEFDSGSTPVAQPTATQSDLTAPSLPTAAVVAHAPDSLPSTPVGWVTGVSNPPPNTSSPGIPQTNNTTGFNIYGTDLGIMWDNEQAGDTHYVLTAFGDTFSGPNMTGDWRSNVLLLSTDTTLYDGTSLLPTGPAYQFIPSSASALAPGGTEVTIIPTSGVAVLGNQYVNYMSIKSWDSPGRWTTNYSAISVYNPVIDEWELAPSTIRSAGWFGSSTPYVPGSQNFQQAAYVLEPEDQVAPGDTRYLYAFGTPSGRAGSAYLSRVAQDDVTDLTKYQYWDGHDWVTGNPAVAAPVIGDSTRSAGPFGFILDIANDPNFFGGIFGGLVGAKTGGNVSEMSVQYNDYLDKYVVLYGDGDNNVEMRTADAPEGPWSDPITLATSAQYPGLYAPMIHPWSGTGELTDAAGNPDVSNLYWNMSIYGDYNVVAMQTDLTPLKTTQV